MDQKTPKDQNGKSQPPAGDQSGAGQSDGKFKIPPVVLKKYGDLVELIKKTESMSDEERDYWFQILPIMTEDQVARLRKILEDESSQLAKLDEQYQSELTKLNKKHLTEWDTLEKTKERESRQEEEAKAEAEESAAEEALLGELDADEGEEDKAA
jgi:hypothetical protein